MTTKSLFINIGKLLLCGVIFSVGAAIGGMVVTLLGLTAPPMPEGMDEQTAMFFMLLESPLSALVLALLARHLSGGFWARALMLFFLTWISNSVNTQIEASAFAGMEEGFWFTILTFLVPALFISMAVAWLFPPTDKSTFMDSVRSFFSRYSIGGWVWRVALAAVIFMPIYYFFGMLVIPFTRSYYEQGMYGLEIPTIDKLLIILFIRSVLFFLACLPILIAWQTTRLNLIWRLGLALFYFVGFQSLLIANWMPWSLRLPHMTEIFFDEFVYAGALVWLLGIGERKKRRSNMNQELSALIRNDMVMFEYDVHDMNRAVQWYQDMFGFEVIYGPTDCHTEFALPLNGARLALSLADERTRIQKGSRVFLATNDIQVVEAYLKKKGAKTKPIENTDNVVLILWVEDPEGNYLAIEQWLKR